VGLNRPKNISRYCPFKKMAREGEGFESEKDENGVHDLRSLAVIFDEIFP
jgi:hypothetical protein